MRSGGIFDYDAKYEELSVLEKDSADPALWSDQDKAQSLLKKITALKSLLDAWKNASSGRYGNIVPGPVYMKQGSTCRGYSHAVTIGQQIEISRGTACRANDGAPWTAQS